MQPPRYARYLCLGLALSSACAVDPGEDESLGESTQGLFVADGTPLWDRYTAIPVCFTYSSDPTAIPLAERPVIAAFLKERIMLTWGAVLPFWITFTDCPTSGTAKHVRVDLQWKSGAGACNAGPDALSTPADRAALGLNAAGCVLAIPTNWRSSQATLLRMQKYILHEFGHVLGFEHEFNRPDATGHPCAAPNIPYGGYMLGNYDEDSIMLSTYQCRNPDQFWLSPGDVTNARYLYDSRVPPASEKDIIWQSTTGAATIWRMSGALMAYEYFIPDTFGSVYKIIGGGDFDGDGIGDLLWRGPDGAVVIWLLDADGTMRDYGYAPLSTDYAFVGIARFNGTDQRSDVLWRSTSTGAMLTWMMNGKFIGYTRASGSTDLHWHIKQVGDFNGDGTADLFWRHSVGATAVWLMNDGAAIAPGTSLPQVDTSWNVTAAGDFDGNGKTDLFWQNNDGRTSIWFMAGASIASSGSPPTVAAGWQVQVAADVDADGKTDLLWRHYDGSDGVWIMDGLTLRENIPMPSAPTSWKMVGVLRGTINPSY